MIEYTIKIKGESLTIKEDHLIYDDLLLSQNNEKLIEQVEKLAKQMPENEQSLAITVTGKLVL